MAGLHADEQGSAVMAETERVTSSFMEEDLVVGSICQLVTPRSSPVSIHRVAICCDGAICQYAKPRYGVISRYTKRHIPTTKSGHGVPLQEHPGEFVQLHCRAQLISRE